LLSTAPRNSGVAPAPHRGTPRLCCPRTCLSQAKPLSPLPVTLRIPSSSSRVPYEIHPIWERSEPSLRGDPKTPAVRGLGRAVEPVIHSYSREPKQTGQKSGTPTKEAQNIVHVTPSTSTSAPGDTHMRPHLALSRRRRRSHWCETWADATHPRRSRRRTGDCPVGGGRD